MGKSNFHSVQDEHFRSAFGIVAGHKVSPVSLRFVPAVAPIIKERRWHATQKVEDLTDGGVRLTITCSQGEELKAWLLSWGNNLTVEEPVDLAAAIRQEHAKAANA